MADEHHEIDPVTGQPTTGHEWDGIKELDTPLPRWWVYTFLACIVFAVGYVILMPAIPSLSDHTKGMLGWTSHKSLARQQQAAKAVQQQWLDQLKETPLEQVPQNPQLNSFALAGGESLFRENCMACHGQGGAGRPGGFPVLVDNDWLWGGTLADIHQTITFGVRLHDEARNSAMPRFGADELLNRTEISQVAKHVLTLSGQQVAASATGQTEEQANGTRLYAEQCASCHGDKGEGNQSVGAPALNDAIWLYGDSLAAIEQQITAPKQGAMPAWVDRLSPDQIKMLALYVHQLGGGT